MTEARVTQAGVSVVAGANAEARITQAGVKAVVRVKPPRVQKPTLVDAMYYRDPGIAGDPHYDKVEFLMSCDDQGVHDLSKRRRKIITYAGGVRLDTAQKRSGVASLWSFRHTTLNGGRVNSGGLRVVGGRRDELWFGSKPFTIDVDLRTQGVWGSTSSHGNRSVVGLWALSDGQRCWWLRVNAMTLEFLMSADGLTSTILTGPTVTPDVWQNIRIDRDKTGRVRMYVNGEMTSFIDWPHTFYRPSSDTYLTVGGHSGYTAGGTPTGTSSGVSGHIDNVRVTVGVARTGSDAGFNPQTELPHVALPDLGVGPAVGDPHWGNVSLFIDPNNGESPVDLSPVGATVTGSPTWTTDTFWGDQSNRSYNVSDVAQIVVDSSAGQFDFDGPFTAEVAARFLGSGTSDTSYLMLCPGSWLLRGTRSGIQFMVYDGVSQYITQISTDGVSFPLWSEVPSIIAVARDEDGVVRLYINGVCHGSFSGVLLPRTGDVSMGGGTLQHRMIAARVTKGVCRYRDNDFADNEMNWKPWPAYGAVGP